MSGAVVNHAVLHDTALDSGPDEKHKLGEDAHTTELPAYYEGKAVAQASYYDEDAPTDEELATLPRIAGPIHWPAYTIAFVELAERCSFYGTTVVYTNFIARPLTTPTGAANRFDPTIKKVVAGALGMGSQAATGITTFNQFWCYVIPLFGAWVADTYLGRFKTIMISVAIALVGHVILVASAAPSVLANQQSSLAAFLIGLIIMGLGTGGFKPNISPLVAEQMKDITKLRVIEKKGQRVIVDPTATINRVYMWFYEFINVGALIGQLSMSYAAYYVGFYLAFLIPTIFFLFCPLVLFFCRNKYNLVPPAGSVLVPALKIFFKAQKGRWSVNPVTTYKRMNDGTFWENMKPSKYTVAAGSTPGWMTWDDAWVDEVARGFAACKVFLWFPLYWLTYNQLNNNLTNQAAIMTLNGIPNDILNNLDPLALIILIPVFDLFIYPAFRKAGIRFTPIKRITLGFLLGTLAMIWAMVIQIYIYRMSDAGTDAYDGDPVDINVWAQTGSYILIAVSEIFASVTSLEYAFSKAPKNMRSLVMSVSLFQSALASAIGEAFNPLSGDPLLVWNYGVMGVLSLIGGIIFWFQFRGLDKREDALHLLPTGHTGTEAQAVEIERRRSVVSQAPVEEKV